MKTKFLYTLILILIVIIVLMNLFQPKPTDLTEYIKIDGKEYILLKSQRDTVWEVRDSIIPQYVPVPGNTIEVEVPADVDTLTILKDYFAKTTYTDTIQLDSVGYVRVHDTISQNMLWSREASYSYTIPTETITTIVKEKPVNQVFLGGGANLDASLYVGGLFKTKKDKIFGVNVGMAVIDNKFTPTVGGSIYWKLNLKKQ